MEHPCRRHVLRSAVRSHIPATGGAARDLTRSMDCEEMTQGGIVNDQRADAASHLPSNLASQFAHLARGADCGPPRDSSILQGDGTRRPTLS